MYSMDEKVALITGAGSGIGPATAVKLAGNGATVAIADLDLDTAQSMAQDIIATGGSAVAYSCDVTCPEDVACLFARIDEELGGLDYAVNNADICTAGVPIADYQLSQLRKTLAVNVSAVFNCLQHEVIAMRRRGAGAIVNVSSVLGVVSGAGYAAYAASKHAVEGLTKSVALENTGHGIRVNCVRPSVMRTPPMTGENVNVTPGSAEWAVFEGMNPSKRTTQPEEIAAGIAWLLCDEASFVTGGGINLDGAYLAQ